MIPPTVLPPGGVGETYSAQMHVAGGAGPYTWTDPFGTLPAGLTIDPATGAITGTPQQRTLTSVYLTVQDSSQPRPLSADTTLTMTIAAALAIATTELMPAVSASPYQATLRATGGSGGYAWSLTAGVLPGGLSLNPGGSISGTPGLPTLSRRPEFDVQVTDRGGGRASASLSLSVGAPAAAWVEFPTHPQSGGSGSLVRLGDRYVAIFNWPWSTTTHVTSDFASWSGIDGSQVPVDLNGGWQSVASGGGRVWLLGIVKKDHRLVTYVFSFDGRSWTTATGNPPFGRLMTGATAWFRDRLWAMVASDTPVWTSPDGATWTAGSPAPWTPRRFAGAAAFAGHLWLCGGFHDPPAGSPVALSDMWSTHDGTTWIQQPAGPWVAAGQVPFAVCAGGAVLYVLVATRDNHIVAWPMRQDGTWLAPSKPPTLPMIRGLPVAATTAGDRPIVADPSIGTFWMYSPGP